MVSYPCVGNYADAEGSPNIPMVYRREGVSLMLKMLFEILIAIVSAATSSLVEWLLNKKRNSHGGNRDC